MRRAWAKKVAASLGGAWPRAIRSGTGRGGDVTGSRNSSNFKLLSQRSLLAVLGAGRRNGRAVVAERDPDILVALRLPLDEAVAGLGPGHDVFILVVENELALVGLHRQHGMTLALLVAHDGDQQRLARPSCVGQHLALHQHIVLAIAVAV